MSLSPRLADLMVLLAPMLIGCTVDLRREACRRDVDCGDDAVCYYDARCVPRAVVERLGSHLGGDCTVSSGIERGCRPNEICRLGYCRGDAGVGEAGTTDAEIEGAASDGAAVDGSPVMDAGGSSMDAAGDDQ